MSNIYHTTCIIHIDIHLYVLYIYHIDVNRYEVTMNDFEVSKICRALGDENRLKIISLLVKGEKCACELLEWKFCQIVNLFKAVKMENGRFTKSTAVVLRNSSSILKQFNAGKTICLHLLVTAENPVVAAITKKWRIDYVEFYSKSDIRNGLA